MKSPRRPVIRGLAWCCAVAALAALAYVPAAPDLHAGGIPPASGPECVMWCGGGSSGGGGSRDAGDDEDRPRGGLFNLFDRLIERSEQAAAERRAAGHQQNELGVAAYNRGNYAEALRLFRLAAENDPDDTVIRQNMKNAEAEVARLEREKQRQDEAKREQAEFRKRMAKLAALMPAPKLPTDPGQAKSQVRPVVPLPGFNPAQWQEYLDAKEEVDRLYARLNREGGLSDADAKSFYAALRRRNELWDQARSRPMEAKEREQVRLPLAVVDSKIRQVVTDTVLKLTSGSAAPPAASPDRRASDSSQVDAITNTFVADYSTEKGTRLIEDAVKEAVESARGQKWADRFEHLLGIGSVAVAAGEEGRAGAGAEMVDLVISKFPEPMSARAEMAVEGGRLYSNVAYRALNRFMEDASKVTGGRFDPEASRTRFEEDLTQSQQGVAAWVRFGK